MLGLSDANATQIKPLKKTYDIAGKKISFESGKLGLLINGSVTISDEQDNILFVTAGIKEAGLNEKADFFPLSCEYQEKYYATGKIGGNRFMKREGRPSEAAILASRLIDRPIRPMFPKGIVNDTQIIATILSSDGSKDMGFQGITGASIALMMSGAPFEGPVAGIKISLDQDGNYIYDPSHEEQKNAKLNLIVAGTLDAITMVEAEAHEVDDETMVGALEYAHGLIKTLCEAQQDYMQDYEKQFGIPEVKISYNLPDESLFAHVRDFLTEEKLEVLYGTGKKDFQHALDQFDIDAKEHVLSHNMVSEELLESDPELECIGSLVYKRVKEVMRKNVLENGKRLDGRSPKEVRDVIGDTGILPRAHGSALFQRGMTQALSIATLGGPEDLQIVDGMFEEETQRYIHHYNFPPYSVGETRMLRGVGRREVGHGKLAEKALVPVLPTEEEFPYMMRVVSEITTCNGSSSMASICGSTMSLMHAGVPIKAPVGGVAMGMIYDEATGKYVILSDIQAQEDFLGDMDFKVGRTKNGITAMQLDVKIKGLSMDVFRQGFAQANTAVDEILDAMLGVIPEVAPKLSPYAPLIMSMQVPEDKISAIIGKGGENVQRMEKEYSVTISIADDGMTTITAKDQIGGEKAIADIKEALWTPELGYKGIGKVVKIIDGTGAIVEFRGKHSGMIHISKLAAERVAKVEDIVKQGDEVEFEIIQVDLAKGRIGLKRKFEVKEVKKEEKKEENK
ncbi:polyribonucleotide nucleotidyltransferase [Candidatus Gracilibacteria bacterium]|nr:polyribonucleotide nucleotidyltransferase [Candidatus Gracilibacteria bacterium]